MTGDNILLSIKTDKKVDQLLGLLEGKDNKLPLNLNIKNFDQIKAINALTGKTTDLKFNLKMTNFDQIKELNSLRGKTNDINLRVKITNFDQVKELNALRGKTLEPTTLDLRMSKSGRSLLDRLDSYRNTTISFNIEIGNFAKVNAQLDAFINKLSGAGGVQIPPSGGGPTPTVTVPSGRNLPARIVQPNVPPVTDFIVPTFVGQPQQSPGIPLGRGPIPQLAGPTGPQLPVLYRPPTGPAPSAPASSPPPSSPPGLPPPGPDPNLRILFEAAKRQRTGRAAGPIGQGLATPGVTPQEFTEAFNFAQNNSAGTSNLNIAAREAITQVSEAIAADAIRQARFLAAQIEHGDVNATSPQVQRTVNELRNQHSLLQGVTGEKATLARYQLEDTLDEVEERNARRALAPRTFAKRFKDRETEVVFNRLLNFVGQGENEQTLLGTIAGEEAKKSGLTQREGRAELANLLGRRGGRVATVDPTRLLDKEALIQTGFAGLFGGIPGLIGAGVGGSIGGAGGVFAGSVAAQAITHSVGAVFEQLAHHITEAAKAGIEFQQSLVSIAATFSTTSRFVSESGSPLAPELQFTKQLARARELQQSARDRTAPLGIGLQTEANLAQALLSGAGAKGVNLSAQGGGKLVERFAATIRLLAPELEQNESLIRRDIFDISRGVRASRTALGSRLDPTVVREIGEATSEGDYLRATQALESFVDTLKNSNLAVTNMAKIEQSIKSLQATAGLALDEALEPSVKFISDLASNEDFKNGAATMMSVFGSLVNFVVIQGTNLSGFAKGGAIGGGASIVSSALKATGNQELATGLNVINTLYKFSEAAKNPQAKAGRKTSEKAEIKPLTELQNILGEDILQREGKREDALAGRGLRTGSFALKALTFPRFKELSGEQAFEIGGAARSAVLKDLEDLSDEESKLFGKGNLAGLARIQNRKEFLSVEEEQAEGLLTTKKASLEDIKKKGLIEQEAGAAAAVADAERKLINIRREQTEIVGESIAKERERNDAIRKTFDTQTFQGKLQDISQVLANSSREIASLDTAITRLKAKAATATGADKINLESQIEELTNRRGAVAVENAQAGREQARAPLTQLDALTNRAKAQQSYDDAVFNSASRMEQLSDSIAKTDRALASFADSLELQGLNAKDKEAGLVEQYRKEFGINPSGASFDVVSESAEGKSQRRRRSLELQIKSVRRERENLSVVGSEEQRALERSRASDSREFFKEAQGQGTLDAAKGLVDAVDLVKTSFGEAAPAVERFAKDGPAALQYLSQVYNGLVSGQFDVTGVGARIERSFGVEQRPAAIAPKNVDINKKGVTDPAATIAEMQIRATNVYVNGPRQAAENKSEQPKPTDGKVTSPVANSNTGFNFVKAAANLAGSALPLLGSPGGVALGAGASAADLFNRIKADIDSTKPKDKDGKEVAGTDTDKIVAAISQQPSQIVSGFLVGLQQMFNGR